MEINVTINPDGTTKVDIECAVGNECETVTDAIKQALAGEVVSDVKKPEYYEEREGTVASENSIY